MKKLNLATAIGALCITGFACQSFAANLTDAEIAKIVETANTAEIRAGQMAESKSMSPEVKDFAKDMVKAHETSNKDTRKWAKKSKVKPKDSDTSRALKDDASQKMTALEKADNGKDFDKVYVQSQIEMHKKVLDSINNDLLPNAKNADLKSMLEQTRSVVGQHLEHAQHLMEAMNNSAADSTTK